MAGDLARARSLLWITGTDEQALVEALASEADAVVADLEDTVTPAAKPAAREVSARVYREVETRAVRLVRINPVDTELARADLAALADVPVDAIVLPKATPQAVAALGADGPPILALVETALGVWEVLETARSPRVVRLELGAFDLAADTGLEPRPDGQEILYARSRLVLASAAAGIRGPFDVVFADLHDPEGFEAETRFARSLGFRGKACLDPSQVEIANRVFTPSAEEVVWARRVIAAYEDAVGEGRGAIELDGQMIELPVVARARKLLAESVREPV